jgi:glycosyltransferase involved in cell wall biosynthesis
MSGLSVALLNAYFLRPNPGGGELHTEQLARALRRRGHEATVFTDEPAERRPVEGLDVRTYPTPAKLNPVNELALARRAAPALEGYDAVVLTDEAAWHAVRLDVPTVMVFHLVWHGWVARTGLARTAREKPQALVYRAMERRIAREADAVVAISENVREDIERIATADPDRIHDIPNGVDIERFHPDAADRTGRFTVHFQGRLVGMKNPDLLVEAVARSEGDWRLTVGGDGPLRERLARRAREAGVDDRVELLGYVPDEELPATYARSHVYALPSDYEGMPLTVLEAAAAGCALVASPRAATSFVTEEVGRVVEPGADALARTLDELAADPERTARLGAAARERAEGYSWDAVAGRYESLLRSLTRRH